MINKTSNSTDTSDEEPAKLFDGGLGWETTEEKLQQYFGELGVVIDSVVMKNMDSGQSRFATFSEPDSVEKVLVKSIHLLDGRPIDPKPCSTKAAIKSEKNSQYPKIFLGGLPLFWISFVFLAVFLSPVKTHQYQSDDARISTCARSKDELPFPEKDEIEVQLDWIDDKNEMLFDMCAANIRCCSLAEDLSLHRYVHHSLDIENIDDDGNALLDASIYVDKHLKLKDISIKKFLLIHKMILKGKGGNFRSVDVGVQNPVTKEIYSTPSFKSINKTMPDYIEWIKKDAYKMHPVQSAILIKLNLVKIHPFKDGNGRMSRLLFNWVLRQNDGIGWVPFFRADIEEYYSAVTKGTEHNLTQFLGYAVKAIAKSYDLFQNDLLKCCD